MTHFLQFHTLSDFFHMGGYGKYVWSAFAFVGIIFISNWIQACREHKRILTKLRSR